MQNSITLEHIKEKISKIALPADIDFLVYIGRGGIIPGAMLNQRLKLPYSVLQIRFRDDTHTPEYDSPRLMDASFDIQKIEGKTILLIDDVCRTGSTFSHAKEILSGAKKIYTFAVNGNADFFLYNGECFRFPWLL